MSAFSGIELHGVRKVYGSRCVLEIDSLRLDEGVSYALVGPNGSGKSTLLRIVAGTIDPSEGSVRTSPRDAVTFIHVGYLPQHSYVFGFSVFRNVALALRTEKLGRSQVEERVMRALQDVGMADMAGARGSGLSGGEAQRVALARILVRDLNVVLLDEPTASLDVAATLQAEKALERYRKQHRCLVVTATHAPAQARRISEHAIMLHDGQVVENGPTTHVLEHPESPQGAAFLEHWKV